MNSIYDFIVEPIGDRYDNIKTVGGKDLILNTKVESWKFVNSIINSAVPAAPCILVPISNTVSSLGRLPSNKSSIAVVWFGVRVPFAINSFIFTSNC